MVVPSAWSFRMKFTTPEIASEPYTAEALPVSTSMRSIMPIGMLEMSVKLLRPLNGSGKSAMRRPLTSTRVWLGPSPRRSTSSAPGEKSAPLEDCWLCVSPLFWVIARITSGTLAKPAALISCAVTTVTGAGPSTCTRGMREPVTCTSSSRVACSGSGSAESLPAGAGADGGAVRRAALTITTAPDSSCCMVKPLPASSRRSASSVDSVPRTPAVRSPRSWSAW